MRCPSASRLTNIDLNTVEKHVPPEQDVTFSGQEYPCNIMNKHGQLLSYFLQLCEGYLMVLSSYKRALKA